MKVRLGVLCGGRSGEHEVSLQSANSIYRALDRDRFDPLLVAIDKDGEWHTGTADTLLLDAGDPEHIHLNPEAPTVIPTGRGGHCVLLQHDGARAATELDAILPMIHGTDGEDGALQGLLRLFDVPFVGADVLGSAIGMDKDVAKRLLTLADLPVAPYETLHDEAAAQARFDELAGRLGLPLYVKPAVLGSSVGVSRCGTREEYAAALRLAFGYGEKVLVEQAIVGREVEVSVLGSRYSRRYPPAASRVGEIRPRDGFYSYRAKYLDPQGAELMVPADLPPETEARVQEVALRVFDVLECEGMARVDCFAREGGGVVVNELNTLPGFTSISMYPKLWEASGLPYTELLTRLVELALERHERRRAYSRNYDFA
ncbi:MAG TPA: D-alanine--D-alanine ligase family protein [bacterium]|nr:D-alanine--D-alanine ligase family protein [bacterium]